MSAEPANKNEVPDDQFNIESMYQDYLRRVKMPESKMGSTQRVEMRRAFFGASGILLLKFRDELGAIEDEETAVLKMQSMLDQCSEFWNNQHG